MIRQPPEIFLGAYIINYGLFCGIKRLYPLEDLKNSLFCAVNFCCGDSSRVKRYTINHMMNLLPLNAGGI